MSVRSPAGQKKKKKRPRCSRYLLLHWLGRVQSCKLKDSDTHTCSAPGSNAAMKRCCIQRNLTKDHAHQYSAYIQSLKTLSGENAVYLKNCSLCRSVSPCVLSWSLTAELPSWQKVICPPVEGFGIIEEQLKSELPGICIFCRKAVMRRQQQTNTSSEFLVLFKVHFSRPAEDSSLPLSASNLSFCLFFPCNIMLKPIVWLCVGFSWMTLFILWILLNREQQGGRMGIRETEQDWERRER